MNDPYPHIWKIDIKKNGPVIMAYIKNFLYSTPKPDYTNKSAGDIYYESTLSINYGMYDYINQLNRWTHPFPLNKFFLWFPGIRWNNVCDNTQLPNGIILFQPNVMYHLTSDNQSNTLSLIKWKKNTNSALTDNNKDNRIITTLIVTTLIIILSIFIFNYLLALKMKNK
jgi:hypothetical protein